MAKSLPQLQKQIAALQRQADELKKREAKGVIARIKEAISHYDLTPDDLGFAGRAARAAKKNSAGGSRRAKKSVSKIKYRDDAGNTWTGHGRRPRWFLDALAAGKSADDMRA